MYASVSVIIPCYRCADTLQRAIDSVMVQTLLPKEILLIDDFSNDDGATLAALYYIQSTVKEIELIIIELSKNSGPGSARNAGWEKASSTYLAFLDADDSWHPKKLEIQYQWMVQHPNIVMSGHPSRKILDSSRLPALPGKLISQQINKYKLLITNSLPTRSVMLKRDLAFRFIPEKRYAEDYLLWLSIVFSGQQTRILNMTMAYSYKEDFGEDGLTADLWKAQKGVIDTFRRIYDSNFISWGILIFISGVSYLKYFRRRVLIKW